MDFIGKWKFHSFFTRDDDGNLVYMNAEEFLNSPMPYIDENDSEAVEDEMEERRKMIKTVIEICDDGHIYPLIPIPDGVSWEEVKAVVDSGELKLRDGMLYDIPFKWEIRNGELWYDNGIEGTVYDEPAETWQKAIDEDGLFVCFATRFEKIK